MWWIEEKKQLLEFALCEGSKYIFYLQYEAGPIYKPASRDFELVVKEVMPAERQRLASIWTFWEKDSESETEVAMAMEEEVHPDQMMF